MKMILRISLIFFSASLFGCLIGNAMKSSEIMDLKNIVEFNIAVSAAKPDILLKVSLKNISDTSVLINYACRLSAEINIELKKDGKILYPDVIHKLRNVADQDFIEMAPSEIRDITFRIDDIYRNLQNGKYSIQVTYYSDIQFTRGGITAIIGKRTSDVVYFIIE